MNKKLLTIIEIIIWLLITVGLIIFGTKTFNDYLNSRKVIEAIFKDVDSIMIGSPVRLMGVQVGHVAQIRPINDEVVLKIVITDTTAKIPQKIKVGVESYGLAGSRSIEILPLDLTEKDKNIKITEPIRLNSLFEVQKTFADIISDYSESVLGIIGDKSEKELNSIKNSTEKSKNKVETITNILDENTNNLLLTSTKVNAILTSQNKNFSFIEPLQKNNSSSLAQTNKKINDFSELLGRCISEDYTADWANTFQEMNQNTANLKPKMQTFTSKSIKYYHNMNNTSENLKSFSGFVNTKFNKEKINQLHSNILELKTKIQPEDEDL